MSTRRVASATSVAPQARKNSLPPPNVPVPKLSTGTFNPERPSVRNSIINRCYPIERRCGLKNPSRKKQRPPAWRPLSEKNQDLRRNPGRWLRHSPSSGRGRGFVQNPVVDGEQRQLQPVRHADLVIHVAQIILDDLLGRPQLR